MNFYSFHIGDYAAHTRCLSLLEDLAYRRLLDVYYLNEHPLNGCSTDVAREIGMRDYVDEVEYVLNKFFEFDADLNCWGNKRADEEIARFKDKQDKASNAGKASAERRSNGRSTPVQENSTDVQRTSSECSTNQEPVTSNHKPEEKREAQSRGARLPTDWKADEELLEFCRTTRPDLNCFTVEATFRDYWIAQPGQKGVKKDWPATWRNWVRNEKQVYPPRGQAKTQPGTSALFEQNMRNAQLAKELIFGKQTEVIDHE